MDAYRKCLVILESLFNQFGNEHWAKWLAKDIYEWDSHGSTSHHQSAFGGMGSLNDQLIGYIGPIGCWQNALIDNIKTISWTYATERKIKVLSPPSSVIENIVCETCGSKTVTSIEIERVLSERHIPDLINAYLASEEFMELTKIELLMQNERVDNDRTALKNVISGNNITISEVIRGTNACPKCNSADIFVVSWVVFGNPSSEMALKKSWWEDFFSFFKCK